MILKAWDTTSGEWCKHKNDMNPPAAGRKPLRNQDNMTITSQEIHEAETEAIADELRAKEELEALKARASEVLSSPYVRGGAVLGIAAAGYAYVRRKKTHWPEKAPERSYHTGDIVKLGSLLLSLAASFASAMNKDHVEPSASIQNQGGVPDSV